MKAIQFVAILLLCVQVSCQLYDDARQTVAGQERETPLAFLDLEGSYRPNFWGTKWVLEGAVNSTATVVGYKDVRIKVNYFTKTETLLGSEIYTLYEYVRPGNSQQFRLKLKTPEGTAKLGWELVEATPVD